MYNLGDKRMIGNRTQEELKADIDHVNKCLNPLSLYSTIDLARELSMRQEVDFIGVEEYIPFQIFVDMEEPYGGEGKCMILVVKE